MITIIFDKPRKSVEISSYGVGSYTNKKTGKMVYTVYGIANTPREIIPMTTVTKQDGTKELVPMNSPLVGANNELEKYKINQNDVVIYRADTEENAYKVKDFIDYVVANGFRVFSMEMYQQHLIAEKELLEQQQERPSNVIDMPTKAEVTE